MLTLLVVDIFRVYEFLIVAYCLLSWFPGAYESKIGQLLIKLCQPYLDLFDFIPPIAGISFSPIVALIVLELAENLDIILLTTKLPMFSSCGLLYEKGLGGGEAK